MRKIRLSLGAQRLRRATVVPPPASGHDQTAVARVCGVSRQLVGQWCEGVSVPSIEHAVQLRDLLAIDPAEWATMADTVAP